ncbi:glutamate receptor-like [Homarus americanus]|uniref:glutamate receptor-like n=1 Tax=Homarus americanus TaxID=6706 RepID=UPI001C4885D7|nr:glutamate receptor-like [Homarus americanus]
MEATSLTHLPLLATMVTLRVFLLHVVTTEQVDASLAHQLVRRMRQYSGQGGDMDEHSSEDVQSDNGAKHSGVEVLVSQVAEEHLNGCCLMVATEGHHPDTTRLLRTLAKTGYTSVLVDADLAMASTSSKNDALLHQLRDWEHKISCCALVLYLNDNSSSTVAFRFLQAVGVWRWPETRVLVVGPESRVQLLLRHESLRNTIHILYFVPTPLTSDTKPLVTDVEGDDAGDNYNNTASTVYIYERCLYCRDGSPDVVPLGLWDSHRGYHNTVHLFKNPFADMGGHKLRVVGLSFFPFIKYDREGPEAGSTVTPHDCLDHRMLQEMSERLNFTFEVRLPVDDQWGTLDSNGSWTGMVGTLAMEKADISSCLFSSQARNKVIRFTRTYAPEPLVIVTHKPLPLPQYLAVIKPFKPLVWLTLMVACSVAGMFFWLLQQGTSHHIKKLHNFNLVESVYQTIGILLEQTPFRHPSSLNGRMWVVWWSMFSLILVTMYRSSLVANLTAPEIGVPVNTIKQLLQQDGWTWGIEPGYGLGWNFLKFSNNTDVKRVFARLEVLEADEQIRRMMEGRHAFFTWKNYAKTLISAKYTDDFGYSPLYVSLNGFTPGGCGWGCRIGAPFLRSLDTLMHRLLQNRLVHVWLQDLFLVTALEARRSGSNTPSSSVTSRDVVLKLYHLQSAFYLYFLGLSFALLTFILEFRPLIRHHITTYCQR